MAKLPHLPLVRLEYESPRKKHGYGSSVKRDTTAHGNLLSKQVANLIQTVTTEKKPEPKVFQVKLADKSIIDDVEWERSGLTLLSDSDKGKVVVFSPDANLSGLKERLEKYETWEQTKSADTTQKYAPYNNFFGNIESFEDLSPDEKIGRQFRLENIQVITDLSGAEYNVDVELYHLGGREDCESCLQNVRALIEEKGGEVSDSYIGDSLILLRTRLNGNTLQEVLKLKTVNRVDLPPVVALEMADAVSATLEELPKAKPPSNGAQSITVIDSGITSAHPLLDTAIGEAIAVPVSLGNADDELGHGTAMSGLALYSDVAACLSAKTFTQKVSIFSAKVLNAQGKFDDKKLVDTQMREAIRYFHNRYKCRVFNLSLGNPNMPFQGGKVSTWASTLDELARELDVVIVVSAGNFYHSPPTEAADTILTDYPEYLFGADAAIVEPATGALVITVGALAHSSALSGPTSSYVSIRPISQENQPSPFTRSGPGPMGAIKPDFCEVGGNCAYDGGLRRRSAPSSTVTTELGVLSLHNKYLDNLFRVDVGTSRAAPVIAHKAALIFEEFPKASANLVKALLASSANVPGATQDLFAEDKDRILRVCGYGQPNLDLARASTEARVVMYAEAEVPLDAFHIYEVPIPDEFSKTKGKRSISVSLAFDPPVRHTRNDYLGATMSFRLLRGKTIDEVVEAFRQREKSENKVDRLTGTKYECKMSPSPNQREGGTLQKGTFVMSQEADYGSSYFLVVSAGRVWAPQSYEKQRYAVVVALEQSGNDMLYAQLQARVRVPQRIRI